jgi:hypothetical protein
MDVKVVMKNHGRIIKLSAFSLFLVVLSLAGWRWSSGSDSDLTPTVYAQQDAMLDRRIGQIEQRFYYLETRINRLESDTRYSSVSPATSATSQLQISQMRTELDTLRNDIESLRLRVGDVECGLLKIDERTLSPAARQRRRSAQGPSEPCRAEPESPIRLASRP